MIPRLHLVTDDVVLEHPHFFDTAVALIRELRGHIALHLRGPHHSGGALFSLAQRLKEEAEQAGTLLVINDRVDVALCAHVPAAHLGARSLPVSVARELLEPGAVIGFSAHSAAEAAKAAQDGANFVFAGSIYRTASHPGAVPAGLALLRACADACQVPVLAIGGVDTTRVAEVRATGAHGVAVIRAVWHAAQPVQAAREFTRMLES